MSEATDRLDAANAALTAFTESEVPAFAAAEAAHLDRKRALRDELVAAEQAVSAENEAARVAALPADATPAPDQVIEPHVPADAEAAPEPEATA